MGGVWRCLTSFFASDLYSISIPRSIQDDVWKNSGQGLTDIPQVTNRDIAQQVFGGLGKDTRWFPPWR